jgi:hypothetical protein
MSEGPSASWDSRTPENHDADDVHGWYTLGLSLSRTGEHAAAAQYLALAAAMRPLKHYTEALRQVRATLEAQASRWR